MSDDRKSQVKMVYAWLPVQARLGTGQIRIGICKYQDSYGLRISQSKRKVKIGSRVSRTEKIQPLVDIIFDDQKGAIVLLSALTNTLQLMNGIPASPERSRLKSRHKKTKIGSSK